MNLMVLGVIFLSLRIGRNSDRKEKIDFDGHQLVLCDVGGRVDLGDGRERDADVEVGLRIGA